MSFFVAFSSFFLSQETKTTKATELTGFQTIQNNSFWKDNDGNPIYSQGGGIFKFGDTYYWYGVRYTGAESYYNNPTKYYNNTTKDVKFVAITAYSSKDLVNWKFEGNIVDTSTALNIDAKEGDAFSSKENLGQATWIGRLGVTYNKNTNKYVLLVQMEFGDANPCVLFIQSDTPTGKFNYANIQKWISGSPTQGTGDQTVFIDDDNSAYLIFSKRKGRDKAFVSKISDEDSLSIEPAVEVASVSNGKIAAGREGNTMFKKKGKYYIATSDLHGWNSSATHIIESDSVQGTYSKEYTLKGTEKDYSHVTQTGFFVTVQGSKEETVIYCGDRWSDFAWNGIGIQSMGSFIL